LLFVGGNVMRRFGWLASALTTPVILLLTGVGFFGSIVFADSLAPLVAYFGTTPLFLSVIFGTMQNIASKSTKYSSFDLAKETLFSVLPQEVKVKGKAIIDVPVSRGGKSLSALWIQVGLLIFGSLPLLIPCNAVLLFFVITLWIYSSFVLSRSFAQATKARGDALSSG